MSGRHGSRRALGRCWQLGSWSSGDSATASDEREGRRLQIGAPARTLSADRSHSPSVRSREVLALAFSLSTFPSRAPCASQAFV